MKIYVKSTKVTSANDDMQTKVNKLAKAIHDFYYFVWDPYELEEPIPSAKKFAKLINEEIASGRKEITLDDDVSYNLQALYEDIKDDDSNGIASQAKKLLDELKALRGITTITSATHPLKPINDYLALRAMYNADLYNAILDGDVAYVQQFIENQDPEDIERYDRNLDMKALMVETQQSADEMNKAINRGEHWMGM